MGELGSRNRRLSPDFAIGQIMAMNTKTMLEKPTLAHRATMDALLNVLGSVLEPKSAVYISGPINGGKRNLDWYKQSESRAWSSLEAHVKSHRIEVVDRNVKSGLAKAKEIRRQEGAPVIEPFSFYVDSWTQHDYRYFWAQVIEKFVFRVVLLSEWHFSEGASFECLIGITQKTELVEDGQVITGEKARLKLKASIEHLSQAGVPTEFLRHVYNEMERCTRTSEEDS